MATRTRKMVIPLDIVEHSEPNVITSLPALLNNQLDGFYTMEGMENLPLLGVSKTQRTFKMVDPSVNELVDVTIYITTTIKYEDGYITVTYDYSFPTLFEKHSEDFIRRNSPCPYGDLSPIHPIIQAKIKRPTGEDTCDIYFSGTYRYETDFDFNQEHPLILSSAPSKRARQNLLTWFYYINDLDPFNKSIMVRDQDSIDAEDSKEEVDMNRFVIGIVEDINIYYSPIANTYNLSIRFKKRKKRIGIDFTEKYGPRFDTSKREEEFSDATYGGAVSIDITEGIMNSRPSLQPEAVFALVSDLESNLYGSTKPVNNIQEYYNKAKKAFSSAITFFINS